MSVRAIRSRPRPVRNARNTRCTTATCRAGAKAGGGGNRQSALARSLERRRTQLKKSLDDSRKANAFVDRRIGEYDNTMSREDQNLARIVRERSRRSKRVSKFALDGDDNDTDGPLLTHKVRTKYYRVSSIETHPFLDLNVSNASLVLFLLRARRLMI